MSKLKQFKRKSLLNLNKHQQQILTPVFISCFISAIIIMLSMFFLYAPEKLSQILKEDTMQIAAPIILIGLSLLLVVNVFWTYRISSQLVGAFDRIIRELDDVLAGTRTKPIGTRRGDMMFEALLKRINTLIEKNTKN